MIFQSVSFPRETIKQLSYFMGTNFVQGFPHHKNNYLLQGKKKKKEMGNKVALSPLVIILNTVCL